MNPDKAESRRCGNCGRDVTAENHREDEGGCVFCAGDQ